MLKVEVQTFENLNDTERLCASSNGRGREWASYLRVTHNGETIVLENDAMEPEDVSFHRDLEWIVSAIERAYALGVADGSREGP